MMKTNEKYWKELGDAKYRCPLSVKKKQKNAIIAEDEGLGSSPFISIGYGVWDTEWTQEY
ncbi:MAG: hypothetical protein HQK83_04485 [Fibrobacteria bacterium]|nr:hypothetical protein [Fibrobacteria bacterium]